jgi:H+/Cl- antiporter ClcA
MTEGAEATAALPDAKQYLQMIGIAALIGIPAALLAAGFLALVHTIEDWLWTDLPAALNQSGPPWYLVIALPVAGAAIVLAARKLLPGDGGHEPLEGIGGGAVPWKYGPSIALAALGTLAFGAVLGPEAPLIALGSVVGTAAVTIFKTKGPGEVVLATAGSFSAVSALFGGPLVAGILLLEGGLAAGTALLPALLPGLVAAAVGYLLFVGLGSWGGLDQAGLAVPGLPLYDGTYVLDLLLAIAVGVLTAVLIALVRKLATRVQTWSVPRPAAGLLLGGLAVGVLAEVARLLGADSQEILFSGQAGVPTELATVSVGVLVVVVAAKGLGYAISLGAGFRGGPVFPAIFLGIGVATVAVIALDVSPTWAVAVGTAAGMAAGTRMVFSSLLFSSLLVGTAGVDAVPAAVLAVVAAWLTMKAVDRRADAEAA